jgi:hypothetical protein
MSHRAIGYSTKFDFGEAIKDAISKLPSESPPLHPDAAKEVVVTEITARSGGNIQSRLEVTILQLC